MEIGNAISQDLENFGKGRSLTMAVKRFWILFEGISKYPGIDMTECS